MARPRAVNMKNSPIPKARMTGRITGSETASISAPATPPKALTVNAAPKARAACPRRAKGCPSRMVAWDEAVPGTPSITDATVSLVAVTANMPSRRAKAGTASMPSVNGKSTISPVTPPIPGTAPSQSPRNTPSTRKPIAGHWKTSARPVAKASSISRLAPAPGQRGRSRPRDRSRVHRIADRHRPLDWAHDRERPCAVGAGSRVVDLGEFEGAGVSTTIPRKSSH